MAETLWTIQDEAAFDEFQKTGILRADPEFLIFDGGFQRSYDWMVQQMCTRIGEAPLGVQYPIWAWYQWEGKRKRRDLRCSGYAQRGAPMVQITFEAERKDFLLSDFDAWHFVLNNHYLADSEQDWDTFYANVGNRNTSQIVASWNKIFDLTRYTPGWDPEPYERSIQATLWEVHMSQVKAVEHFIAK